MESILEKAFSFIEKEEEVMKQLWFDLTKIESQSIDREGVNAAVRFLEENLKKFGMKTKIFDFGKGGNSITAYFDNKSEQLEMVLLGHLDTVHPTGLFGKEVIKVDEDNDTAYGPGILDCKGGIIVASFVARVLEYIGYEKMIKLVFSGDEEVAHSTTEDMGKNFFLEECKGFKSAIDCETGFVDGRIVVGRKGSASFRMTIKGKSAHAGNEPQNGISSIREAANKIIAIESVNNYENTHYNVGVINGGTSGGSISEDCVLDIGVRYRKTAELDNIRKFLQEITNKSYVDGTNSQLEELRIFDPMDQTEENMRLFDIVKENSEKLGFGTPYPCFLGGASDAAYTVALGIPSLCAMGVQGYENHTLRERAVISSLVKRTKLIVASILSLPEKI